MKTILHPIFNASWLTLLRALPLIYVLAACNAQEHYPRDRHYKKQTRISRAITAPVNVAQRPEPLPTGGDQPPFLAVADKGTPSPRDLRMEARRKDRILAKNAKLAVRDNKRKDRRETRALGDRLADQDVASARRGR